MTAGVIAAVDAGVETHRWPGLKQIQGFPGANLAKNVKKNQIGNLHLRQPVGGGSPHVAGPVQRDFVFHLYSLALRWLVG
jgi:hypothetical protein